MQKDYLSKTRLFNEKQKEKLISICKDLELTNAKFYVGYWCGSEFHILEFNPDNKRSNENNLNMENHNQLNYYWCEYGEEASEYRITMYYKDFDNGSGNIHVLPGAIQMWEKKNCEYTEQGFCMDEINRCKKNIAGEIEYSMIGGRVYCEYGWKPLFKNPVFWSEENYPNVLLALKTHDIDKMKGKIYSNIFYNDVKDYSICGRSGHYMRYSLLKFGSDVLYYKTMLVANRGYFTKYDGIPVEYKYGHGDNKCGPNYYDNEKKCWIFAEKQYITE